jgi:hypothetical protein
MLRAGALLVVVMGVLGSGVSPADATFNWDYHCTAASTRLDLDVTAVFNAGSAGPVAVRSLSATLKPAGSTSGDPGFTSSDVEQFWAGNEEFLLRLSRYVGSESTPARLTLKTTCKKRKCAGHYRYERGETSSTGGVKCEQSDAG